MSDAGWLIVAMVLGFVGMAWLALAMDVHWEQVMDRPATGRPPGPRRMLRILGSAALLLSLLACLMADHPSMAALVWVMLLAAAAPGVALLLVRRPRLLRLLWPWGRA